MLIAMLIAMLGRMLPIAFALVMALAPAPAVLAGYSHHCCDLGYDTDCDCIIDYVDNCPFTFNVDQVDSDGDGRGNVCDNCTAIANGPLVYAPGLAPVSQCDRDSDGYGNACDGDFDANGFVTPADNAPYTAALMAFFPPAPGQNDMNCDGFMTPADNTFYTQQLMAFFPGPSGWSCAGVVTGACPPTP
jgi:hypothetical protein